MLLHINKRKVIKQADIIRRILYSVLILILNKWRVVGVGVLVLSSTAPCRLQRRHFKILLENWETSYVHSLPIEWTHKSILVTLQTDTGPQFASIWSPKFVCLCVIPWSTERVRGLHCLCPLQPLSSISWTWSWLRTVRSKELTAFINWRWERHKKLLCEDRKRERLQETRLQTSQQKDVQRCTS